MDPGSSWTVWEESTFVRAQCVYGVDCCAIARLLNGRSCREVATRLSALRAGGQANGVASDKDLHGRRSRLSKKVPSGFDLIFIMNL